MEGALIIENERCSILLCRNSQRLEHEARRTMQCPNRDHANLVLQLRTRRKRRLIPARRRAYHARVRHGGTSCLATP
jgi:hypothetical protein